MAFSMDGGLLRVSSQCRAGSDRDGWSSHDRKLDRFLDSASGALVHTELIPEYRSGIDMCNVYEVSPRRWLYTGVASFFARTVQGA